MKNLKYKAYSFKLNDNTAERLKDFKIKNNLSYNLAIMALIDKYENIQRRVHNKK